MLLDIIHSNELSHITLVFVVFLLENRIVCSYVANNTILLNDC